jgi:hypothetical protein
MSLLQYTITNRSAIAKTFLYFSASAYHNVNVGGFGTVVFIADDVFTPTQLTTGVPENTFLSDSYIPPSGSAWLWNNGEKVQYIKISDTPLTGSNISSIISKADWIEFSMLQARDKNGNLLYPTATTTSRVERYIIGNVNDKGAYDSIIINSSSPETSIAVSADTSSAETGFSFIDQQFEIDQDCNPLLNNAVEPRINEWLQDVDYSVNAITPVNLEQILSGSATKAAVPQSNYTQLGFLNSRYVGSSTTRDNINEYNPKGISDPINRVAYDEESPELVDKGKGPSLGKIPNVESNNAYIAYFNRVIDPYPLVNNKVAYYAKYLIDEGGNILDPSVSDINFYNFTDTFQLKDYDNKPTRVNTAVSNIEEGKELVKLTDGLHSVYKVGAYPVPILYTQTSSIGNTDQIALSGSEFYTALGGPDKTFKKLGINIYSTQSDASLATFATTPTTLSNLGALDWLPVNITPFSSNNTPTLPTSSNAPTQSLLFPVDDTLPPSKQGPGKIFSDKYTIKGSFTFTTSTMPAKYTGGDNENVPDSIKWYKTREKVNARNLMTVTLSPFVKPPAAVDIVGNYVNTTTGFKIKPDGVKLVITLDPGGSNPIVYPPLVIEEKPPISATPQWALTQTGLVLTPNSLYLEEIIIRNLLNKNPYNPSDREEALPLIAGGWFTNGSGVNFGYGGRPVRYDWTIEFEYDQVVQGTGFYLTCTSTIATQNDDGANYRPEDVFLFIGENGSRRSSLKWKRTFNPTFANLPPTRPLLQYSVTSPLSENAVKNKANGPFWRRYPDPDVADAFLPDVLYMSSSILNQTYGKSYVQAALPYVGDINTNFPLTIEPSFIAFDPVTDFWELKEGDEIRFENNEEFTYRITSIDGRDAITPPSNTDSNNIDNKLRVIISPPFEYTGSNGEIIANPSPTNFDFFVVRRFKEDKNFIILDQQMPYGITTKGGLAFSETDSFVGVEPVNPVSSPGLLLPQHRVSKFNTNPDLILKDLIEKGIV